MCLVCKGGCVCLPVLKKGVRVCAKKENVFVLNKSLCLCVLSVECLCVLSVGCLCVLR